MPAFDRIDRISEEVRRELDNILREDVNDPRIKGTWSITRCEVTRDLRYCMVRISVLEEEHKADMQKALKSCAGFVRRTLGHRMNLRYVPELMFEMDDNIAYAARINRILKETEGNTDDDK